jgi:hypothetical protein
MQSKETQNCDFLSSENSLRHICYSKNQDTSTDFPFCFEKRIETSRQTESFPESDLETKMFRKTLSAKATKFKNLLKIESYPFSMVPYLEGNLVVDFETGNLN